MVRTLTGVHSFAIDLRRPNQAAQMPWGLVGITMSLASPRPTYSTITMSCFSLLYHFVIFRRPWRLPALSSPQGIVNYIVIEFMLRFICYIHGWKQGFNSSFPSFNFMLAIDSISRNSKYSAFRNSSGLSSSGTPTHNSSFSPAFLRKMLIFFSIHLLHLA